MILVALGANLPGPAGEPAAQVAAALDAIDAEIGRVTSCSRFYDSPSWPPSERPPDPPRYVNAVAAIATGLDPARLLAALLALETRLGRKRSVPNAPRTIDLDLIDYDGLVREQPPPILPHPRMQARRFVLLPLAEVAPGWRHPVTGAALADLIAALPQADETRPLAIGWARGAGADRL